MPKKNPATDNYVRLRYIPATMAAPAMFRALVHYGNTYRVSGVQIFSPADFPVGVPGGSAGTPMKLKRNSDNGSTVVYTLNQPAGAAGGNWRVVATFVKKEVVLKAGFVTV